MSQTSTAPIWMSSSHAPAHPPHLLLVDDDRVMRLMMQEALQHQGYYVDIAADAEEAFEIIKRDAAIIDALVLDRELPGMSGLELVEKMNIDDVLAAIPVIMLTGSGQQDEIQQGIDAGVYYYLVKPTDHTLLHSIIESALRERRQKKALLTELDRHGAALKAMKNCQVAIKTLTEAEQAACFLAACFPDAERVVSGFMELLINAVEHGNLGITYEEKQQLLTQSIWRAELDRLAELPENSSKEVAITYQRKADGYYVQITDMGNGFDWKRYWHINPARATASHGRGIARARLMAFDRIAYNEKGNSVTVMVNCNQETEKAYAW